MARRGHTLVDTYKDEAPPSYQNNFIAGLKTEFTGLNFPPNAATDTSNCIYTMLGDVLRREGFDYEANYVLNTIDRTNAAVNSYHWTNVGGDGQTEIVVLQVGSILYFFQSSSSTTALPVSSQLLSSTISLNSFLPTGSTADPSTIECQFSDGNGYLFVYHPYCDPFFCSYVTNSALQTTTISSNLITVQIRDFAGIPEYGVPVNFRSPSLTVEHNYNIQNQGWTKAPLWTAFSEGNSGPSGAGGGGSTPGTPIASVPSDVIFTVASGLSILGGDPVILTGGIAGTTATGTVVSYTGTALVIAIASALGSYTTAQSWSIAESNVKDLIDTWQGALGNYPSNADVWWDFKDATGVFNPSSTVSNIPDATAQAPQGHFILNPFNQQRTAVSGIPNLTDIRTSVRPRTGSWFQGRVWYTGVDASQAASGDAIYTTWTENIYFSQIVTDPSQFGQCYQANDPTDSSLFNLLPSDGGVIVIQGAGSIYKLFPIQNGMLVFAANGVWFITGSTGIGFTATDYTITKISAVKTMSSTSFIDVQGLPIFWNEEGIYSVTPAQQGLSLTVSPLTVGTILTFYNSIPRDSKRFARGSYNPITYVLQWTYRSTQETDITSRYQYDSILCLNVFTKAFYPYSIPQGAPHINGVMYLSYPGGSSAPNPTFKYVTSAPGGGSFQFTFSEERDNTHWVDWYSYDSTGVNYTSYFVTGYQLDGQGLKKWQPTYVNVHSRSPSPTAYKIQGIWNYANNPNSGAYSSIQVVNVNKPYHGMVTRRHKIRGHGYVMQMKISSVDGKPFDIMGWSMFDTLNMGV